MLRERNDIDELFSDYLTDYQEDVPSYIFKNIQSNLKKEKAKEFSFRMQKIAAAIAILIAFGLGYFSSEFNDLKKQVSKNIIFDTNYFLKNDKQNYFVNNDKEDSIKDLKSSKIETKENSELAINIKSINNEINIENENLINNSFLFKFFDFSKGVFSLNENGKTYINEDSKKNSRNKIFTQLLTDTLLLAEGNLYNGDFLIANKQNKKSKWTFGTKFSPVFSFAKNANQEEEIKPENDNSAAKSEIISSIPENETIDKSLTSFSGGLNVNYQISRRWSIQSGIFYSKRRQISENLMSSTSFYEESEMKVYTPVGEKFIQQPVSYINEMGRDAIITKNRDETFYSLDMNFVSNFKYIELPVIIRFKIIDKKVGLDILSGISTNILIANSASIMIEEQDLWTGLNEDINPLLYDATIGFGLNYNFYNNFNFNIEPTFKYSIINQNTVLENYPYSFAVFAGFSYTF
ncbi:MAG: outer membrane beta-barrel protein [Bacteroidales bacterium]|nr:outer membrane beta-barrel protein [Bacteroidales bacterium]MBN2755554.1 outer membrane beta-barrel protein [Bacteroidales bacterium]